MHTSFFMELRVWNGAIHTKYYLFMVKQLWIYISYVKSFYKAKEGH